MNDADRDLITVSGEHPHTHRSRLRRLTSRARAMRLLDTTPSVATDQALKVAGGGFYVSGGVATILLALLSSDVEHRALVAIIGALAASIGTAVARWSGRISAPMRRAMNLAGTTLVMVIVLLCGAGSGGQAAFWLFCYVPVDSFFFFPWRWAIPMVLWGFAASEIAAVGSHGVTLTQWLFSVLVGLVVSIAVGSLVRSAADAEWDSATDMLTRRGLERELERRCQHAEQGGEGFSLACLSIGAIDRGECNRARADLLTLRLAKLVRAHSNAACQWARMRDHELALLWTGSAGVDGFLKTIRERATPMAELSVGVTDWQPGEKPAEVLAAVMRGLRHSQAAGGELGRTGVVAARVAELRRAILSGEIRPHYQPIVRMGDGGIVGAEALARWHHPQEGVIAPDRFIPLAEQTGLITLLGESILLRACADARRWQATDATELKVTVNVSGQQLCETRFVETVADALRRSGLPADQLVLEATESTLYGDDPVAHEALRRLRGLGVRIAIDDFGTGFSNLSRLAHLPADILKVDRSFVAEIESNPRVRSMLHGLAAMSRELGFLTLVEGVETPAQAEIMRALEIPEAQGFLYSRPLPREAFELALAGELALRSPSCRASATPA